MMQTPPLRMALSCFWSSVVWGPAFQAWGMVWEASSLMPWMASQRKPTPGR